MRFSHCCTLGILMALPLYGQLLTNGDFAKASSAIAYKDNLLKAGFQLPALWPNGFFMDSGANKASVKFFPEAEGSYISISNDGKNPSAFAPLQTFPPGDYIFSFEYRGTDPNIPSSLQTAVYRYGKDWAWMGMPDGKIFAVSPDWQSGQAGIRVSGEGIEMIRPALKVTGSVDIRKLSMEKASAGAIEELNRGAVALKASEWNLELVDGAKGDMRILMDGQIVLEKKNGEGYLRLTYRKPLFLVSDEHYSYRLFYHAENAGLWSQLLVRLATDPGQQNLPLSYGLYQYMGNNHIINSPDGVYQKRIMNFSIAGKNVKRDVWGNLLNNSDRNLTTVFPEKIYPVILLHGNPVKVVLKDMEIYAARRTASEERKRYAWEYTPDEVDGILKRRQPIRSQIETVGSQPKLMQNGAPAVPVFYMASENNELVGDFGGMGKIGLNRAIVPVPLYDRQKPENSIWQGNGKYQFEVLDRQIGNVLRKNPNAELLIHYWLVPYQNMEKKYPDEIWEDGKKNKYFTYPWSGHILGSYKDESELKNGAFGMLSYHSEGWKRESNQAVADLTAYLKKSKFANAIAGFFIFSGIDGRLQPGGNDYSPAAIRKFIRWCQNKYGTIESLNQKWKMNLNGFEDLAGLHYDGGMALYPGGDVPVYLSSPHSVDFKRFHFEDIWHLVDSWGKTIKETWGSPVTVGVYRDMDQAFLETEYIDINGNDLTYMTRNEGYAGASWYPMKTAHKKKLWCMDLDLRSYAGPQIPDEEYELIIGTGQSPERWQAIHDKLVGACLASNSGYWYYDMLAYFQDDFIMRTIGDRLKIAQKIADRKTDFSPDVAIVISDSGKLFSNISHNVYSGTLGFWGFSYAQGAAFVSSGVPWDMIYMNDLMDHPELQKYKMYLFANVVSVSDAERKFINEKLKKDGRILVFMYDTGYISDSGPSLEKMSELVGMKIESDGKMRRNKFSMLIPEVLPFQNGAEFVLFNFRQQGMPAGQLGLGQDFWINDPDVQPLALYGNGKTAIAQRDFGTWKSIYLAPPNALGNDLLNYFARRNGIYSFLPAGYYAFTNGNFTSIHALKSGEVHYTLPPGKNRMVDAFSGREYAADPNGKCLLNLQSTQTYWYYLE